MRRGLNTRSFARIACSSRRMPTITASNFCSRSIVRSPSVLRAAARVAGGSV